MPEQSGEWEVSDSIYGFDPLDEVAAALVVVVVAFDMVVCAGWLAGRPVERASERVLVCASAGQVCRCQTAGRLETSEATAPIDEIDEPTSEAAAREMRVCLLAELSLPSWSLLGGRQRKSPLSIGHSHSTAFPLGVC